MRLPFGNEDLPGGDGGADEAELDFDHGEEGKVGGEVGGVALGGDAGDGGGTDERGDAGAGWIREGFHCGTM